MRSKNSGSSKKEPVVKPNNLDLNQVAEVRISELRGEKVCRFTLKDGTWIEIAANGASASGVTFTSDAVVNRSSFDFSLKRAKKAA
jgi:hypothetical protein